MLYKFVFCNILLHIMRYKLQYLYSDLLACRSLTMISLTRKVPIPRTTLLLGNSTPIGSSWFEVGAHVPKGPRTRTPRSGSATV